MPIQGEAGVGTPATTRFNQKLVFKALTCCSRRKLLIALGHGGPQLAPDLTHAVKGGTTVPLDSHYLNLTLKHLKLMVDAGIVVQLDYPQDKRRFRYALHPAIFDFGFVVVRLGPDGN